MIDKPKFYAAIRPFFDGFPGEKGKGQIAGIDAVLDEADKRQTPVRWLAYMLATDFHETAATMQPVREAFWLSEAWRKAHLRYYPYYGRGLVQLTWVNNYAKAGEAVGVDLVNSPDMALELPIAVTIMFDGMEEGWFTGKKLADYDRVGTYVPMRHIINGNDRAQLIADYADRFEAALRGA